MVHVTDDTFQIYRIPILHGWYAVPKLSLLLNVHGCHPAREGDITNCLPARDVLSANENVCVFLKDNNLDTTLDKCKFKVTLIDLYGTQFTISTLCSLLS